MSINSEDEVVKFLVKKGKDGKVSEMLMLVFDKNGRLLAQLTPLEHNEALKDLQDIYVDEMTNTLYLLTKDALYQSPLPTINPADEATQ